MCNGLYLGARQGQPRPDPFWTNPAIKPIASQLDSDDIPGVADTLDPNFTQTIKVTVSNQAGYVIPGILDLYWSDPTTGFLADPTRLIETQYPVLAAADVLGGIDATSASIFNWEPWTTDAPSTNGGHVCLLARISHNPAPTPGGGDCGGGFPDDASPSTDFRSAIHNIILASGGWHMKKLSFAFAATNPLPKAVGTKLTVKPLLPERNPRELDRLLAPAQNYAFAARGNRFGVPGHIGVAIGQERALARPIRLMSGGAAAEKSRLRHPLWRVPRLGFTGVLSQEIEDILRVPECKHAEHQRLDLHGFEIRQAIVTLEPGEGADLFAFEVIHETTEPKPQLLGGLTFIYRMRRRLY
jgi:hypothetical protein